MSCNAQLTSHDYGCVIRRTGTGDVPVRAVPVAALPQPATFITVTFRLPFSSTKLMKTCRNPMTVTVVVPVGFMA